MSSRHHEPWTDQTADLVTGLVFRYLDGVLDADMLGQFNALLLRHEQARDLLALMTTERFVLQDVLQARDTTQNNRSTLLEELAELEAQAETAGPVDITEQIKAKEAAKARSKRNAAASFPKDRGPKVIVIPRAMVWSGIAAVLVLGVALAWPWIARDNAPVESATAPPAQEPGPAVVEAVPFSARITRIHGVGAGPNAALSVGQDISVGQRVVLESGFVEITSNRDVRLVVQGPSTFRFDEALQLSLDKGRLVAEVDEAGVGFTVLTPGGRVVDHGTEFGVFYEPDHQVLETSVFEGSVSLQSNESDAPPRTLTKGWGGRVDAAGEVSIAAEEPTAASRQAYVRVLPETGYAQEVLRLDPEAFWTFDAFRDQRLALNHFNHWVLSGEHNGGPAVTQANRAGAVAGFGKALALGGRDYVDFGDVMGFDGDDAFTFAFWLRAGADGASGSVLSRMSVTQDFRGYDIYMDQSRLLFQLKHKFVSDHEPEKNDALRVEVRGIQAGQWSHVVFAYDGSRRAKGVTAYIDGQPVQTRVLSDSLTGTIRVDAPFRIGRRLQDPANTNPGDRLSDGSFFTGSIDDLMVFSRALTGGEARRLHRAGTDPSQGHTEQPGAGLLLAVEATHEGHHANQQDLLTGSAVDPESFYLLLNGEF